MRVAVVTVGDELLAGDITNTNASWLAGQLTERGVDVERLTTVPDDVEQISAVISDYHERFDAVITTGGLGPTHDDTTMAAVAAAFDRQYTEHPDAVAYFDDHDRYATTDLAPGTMALPEGARLLVNDVGVAPGAKLENVFVLPGVPVEMKSMFERISDAFSGPTKTVEVVRAAEPESALVSRLQMLRGRFDVQVGSYPRNSVHVKLQSADPEEVAEAAAWLRERVESPS